MTTFLGVSPSDVCVWDTKASATDPRVREQLGVGSAVPSGRAGGRGCIRAVASRARKEDSPHPGPAYVPRRCGSAVGTRQVSSPRTSGKKGGTAATMVCSRKLYASRAIVK